MMRRLFVLLLDTVSTEVWSKAVADDARSRGWDVIEGPVANWPKLTDRCVVVSDDPDWGIIVPPVECAVIMMTPPSIVDGRPNDSEAKEKLALASARYAKAAAMLAGGGVRVDSEMTSFTLADLGNVTRPDYTSRPLKRSPSPLDYFATIPPPVGAAAVWPAEIMAFPKGSELDGGKPDMDLTGRARLLFHGPHLYLTPGLWRVTFQISVDPEGDVPPLRFEWKHGEDMVYCDAPINQSGRYEIRLERRWEVVGPSQITGWLMQAIFNGRLELHDCRIEKLADA